MVRRLPVVLGVFLVSVGCEELDLSSTADGGRDAEDLVGTEYVASEDFTYQIDVVPGAPTDEAALALPQSFSVATDQATDLALTLRRPVTVSGVVTAFVPAPRALAPLPGRIEPVDAEIDLLIEQSSQSRFGATDPTGRFSLLAVPGSTYELVVRPRRPDIPFLVEAIDVEADVGLDLFVDLGLALWGRVLDDDGVPMAGVSVHAESADGVVGWADVTDDQGWYTLRVRPGLYGVVATGRASGREPTIRSTMVNLADTDVRVDLTYENLDLVSIGGRVTLLGTGVSATQVRFRSESLTGYDASASHEVEAFTNGSGTFDTRLVPGVYTLEVLPDLDAATTPLVLSGIVVSDDTDLGEIALLPHRLVDGTVEVDGEEAPLAGATIRCTEEAGTGRSWSTSTDALGAFSLSLPQTVVLCAALPPGDRSDLALQRLEIDLATESTIPFRLGTGVPVDGRIRFDDGTPAAFSLVQILDSKGTLWGTAITDGDGRFGLRVAWPAREPTR